MPEEYFFRFTAAILFACLLQKIIRRNDSSKKYLQSLTCKVWRLPEVDFLSSAFMFESSLLFFKMPKKWSNKNI